MAGLTVAVTGATGDVGTPLLPALASCPDIVSIRAMARRVPARGEPTHPKIEYRSGDVCDPASVRGLLAGANVVIHLAFSMFGRPAEMARTNLGGTHAVCVEAKRARLDKLIYASSIAAYGFARRRQAALTECEPTEESPGDVYSSHKALSERLITEATARTSVAPYILRPPIVAGGLSLGLIRTNPHVTLSAKLPPSIRRRYLAGKLGPLLIPHTGVRWQLVHANDLAQAIIGIVTSNAPPGAYNLAGHGDIGQDDVARELGWTAVRVPRSLARAAARMIRALPLSSPRARFLANMLQQSIPVDSTRAREELGWSPVNDALTTLRETVAAARAAGLA